MARVQKAPLEALGGPLSARARRGLARALARLLEWQVTLERWPVPARATAVPQATPIVSLYTDGVLRGCAGSVEGTPSERLTRAFLYAESDLRFGGLEPGARSRTVAQVSYPVRVTKVPLARAAELIAPGAHGLALRLADRAPALLLPDVAREHELDAAGFLSALEHKAGLPREEWPDALFSFETEVVTARLARAAPPPSRSRPIEAAVRWLAARVSRDGSPTFGLEPRTRERHDRGPMHHGRAAVVAQALELHPAGRAAAARLRRWLARELGSALAGRRVAGFPEELPLVAGTLALAKLAGVAFDEPLAKMARDPRLAAVPWHAAQVVCALGADAPDGLYRACVEALERDVLAPWTVMAARARGDQPTFVRAARALALCVSRGGPHSGGVAMGTLPELALTAVVVEALAHARERTVVAARERALGFVGRQQHLLHVPPDVPDRELAFGAFPLTPVHAYLRTDVTAHAALALEVAQSVPFRRASLPRKRSISG